MEYKQNLKLISKEERKRFSSKFKEAAKVLEGVEVRVEIIDCFKGLKSWLDGKMHYLYARVRFMGLLIMHSI